MADENQVFTIISQLILETLEKKRHCILSST